MLFRSGSVDAATAWDSVARGNPKLRTVRIEDAFMPDTFSDREMPEVNYDNGVVPVGLVVLKTAEAPEQVKQFVEFILSPDGQKIWKQAGFNPAGK
mgnify:CR=1 FL=1